MSSPALKQTRSLVQVTRTTADEPAEAIALIEEYYAAGRVVARDDRATLASYIAGPRSAVWVATCGSIPAGCILYRPLDQLAPAGEMKRLYVRPAFRGRGVAAELLRTLEDFARAQGVSTLYLDTNEDFREALVFYNRHGYTACDRYNDNPQATIFLSKNLPSTVAVRLFRAGDEEAFRLLNEAWIEKYFRLEEKDRTTLRDPHTHILAPGGQIFMAASNGETVGCCALLLNEQGVFEVAKMAVAPSAQGQGIGRRLLEFIIEYARTQGIQRLYLETNHTLQNAINLYESVGFRHLPPERIVKSPYQRADVYMEMLLS